MRQLHQVSTVAPVRELSRNLPLLLCRQQGGCTGKAFLAGYWVILRVIRSWLAICHPPQILPCRSSKVRAGDLQVLLSTQAEHLGLSVSDGARRPACKRRARSGFL